MADLYPIQVNQEDEAPKKEDVRQLVDEAINKALQEQQSSDAEGDSLVYIYF